MYDINYLEILGNVIENDEHIYPQLFEGIVSEIAEACLISLQDRRGYRYRATLAKPEEIIRDIEIHLEIVFEPIKNKVIPIDKISDYLDLIRSIVLNDEIEPVETAQRDELDKSESKLINRRYAGIIVWVINNANDADLWIGRLKVMAQTPYFFRY